MIVSEQLLTLFKFGLLAVLYVFFLRVLWAVRSEVVPAAEPSVPQPVGVAASGAAAAQAPAPRPPSPASTSPASVPPPLPEPQTIETPRGLLIVREPEDSAGFSFVLENELTVGRAAGCSIAIEDTFVSQLHARIYKISNSGNAGYPGEVDGYHVEDLGSTNGTFLNGRRLAPNQSEHLELADTIQVGSTVLEFV